MAIFEDRGDAGRKLARALERYADRADVVVLGLPRGGVPVAFAVAKELQAPMDIYLVRKLGVPEQPELAMGAIASGGVRVMNEQVVRSLGISDEQIETVVEREIRELERREQAYRGDRARPDLHGKVVVLVDDGLATGASMRAAVEAVKTQEPDRIVVAVPTAPPETCSDLEDEVEEVVCATTPEPFFGVGAWYADFSQTTDDEVRRLLEIARDELPEVED
jgi:predicted phosphoribosyltransferase